MDHDFLQQTEILISKPQFPAADEDFHLLTLDHVFERRFSAADERFHLPGEPAQLRRSEVFSDYKRAVVKNGLPLEKKDFLIERESSHIFRRPRPD